MSPVKAAGKATGKASGKMAEKLKTVRGALQELAPRWPSSKTVAELTSPIRETLATAVDQALPSRVRETMKLRAFGLSKIPVLFFVGPSVDDVSDEKIVVRIPLNRRTRNHVGSMYFGVLAAGADCACGLLAMRVIQEKAQGKVSLIFKDFKADFLKRAEGDVLFICEQGKAIEELVLKAMESGERENLAVDVIATVPSQQENEPVARFVLTLSLKKR